MKKTVSTVVALVVSTVVLAVLLAVAWALGAAPETVLTAAAGATALLWLLMLLTVPWNLYFSAHTVLSEITVSRDKGLTVPPVRGTEATRIARVMLRIAVAGHLLTAAVSLAVAWATDSRAGYWIAGIFLLSTVFRPAGAWFKQVKRRLRTLLRDVAYPRDDVMELKGEVDRVVKGMKTIEEKAQEHYGALAYLRSTVDGLNASAYRRADEADRKIAALGREFEATVNRLTTNEEIISGLKAFLRLLHTEDLSSPSVPPPTLTA
jgi:hypothetical protein